MDTSTFQVETPPRSSWATGDYVVGIVTDASGYQAIELPNGRDMEVAEGDAVVEAFGRREATLEITGSWRSIGDDATMYALTRAGLFGASESRSTFVRRPLELRYHGHVYRAKGSSTAFPDGPASGRRCRCGDWGLPVRAL